MNQPLLTIAIPTWNRGDVLDEALECLLCQIEPFNNLIQFIVSDNGSDDETPNIIQKHHQKFPLLHFIHYRHEVNIGFFGNFIKCNELSGGQYFWLLSDNDFIGHGLVEYVVNILISEAPEFIFLSGWKKYTGKNTEHSKYKFETHSVAKAIDKFSYRLTFVSAVIFRNIKTKNTEVQCFLKDNSVIGFAYLLNCIDIEKSSVEVVGNSLYISHKEIRFNVFQSFAGDMKMCLNYVFEKGIISKSSEHIIMNSAITDLILPFYISYRIGSWKSKYAHGSVREINSLLSKELMEYDSYKNNLKKLVEASSVRFLLIYTRKKINYLFEKYLFSNREEKI